MYNNWNNIFKPNNFSDTYNHNTSPFTRLKYAKVKKLGDRKSKKRLKRIFI